MNCDDSRCLAFLRNELTNEAATEFELHLDSCVHCQQMLLVHAGGKEVEQQVKQLLVNSGELPFVSTAKPLELTVNDHFDDELCLDALVAADISILSPSDMPDSLGRIGTFEAKAIIGRGGMGTVYKALDPALGRTVAIKVLRPELASISTARQRFSLEARAMASVAHPHVVPIYAVDEHRGLPYLAMEYVAGGTLESRLRQQGPLELISVLRITQQIALALEAAHETGIVHRDIKPANILLDRGIDRVRVADFGLVRVSDDASMTRSGLIAGTPLYMAPEQVRGDLCDGRSDLFSLGSLVYTLLVGEPPFRADSPYASMQRIVHEDARPVRAFRSELPEWLDAFVGKLLAKSPSDRFQSAGEVVRAIDDELLYLQNPGVGAEPERLWKTNPIIESIEVLGDSREAQRWHVGWHAVTLGLLLVAMGWELSQWLKPTVTGNRPLTSSTGSDVAKFDATGNRLKAVQLVESVPLWSNDGFREFLDAMESLSSERRSSFHLEADGWQYEVEVLRRNMAKFDAESP
jgi:serine/threonine protein kinase